MMHHTEFPAPEEMQVDPPEQTSDFWLGFMFGFGSCFALACLTLGVGMVIR